MSRVVILGAGTPTPTSERFGSSHVLQLGEDFILFDCGPATTHKIVKAGLFPTQINYLFFTHHHFDHDIDYPCFLLTRWDQTINDENDLQVYGPPPTEMLTHRLIDEKEGAFAHDWIARVNHPLSQQIHVNRGGTLPRRPPSVMAKDIGPGKVHSGKDWEVTSAVADHVQPWLDSLAYRVDCQDGSIVFTGDTRPCNSVTKLAQGADVMLCMCWDDQKRMDNANISQGQCGTLGAAKTAQEAGVDKLVLVHIGPELTEPGEIKRAIQEMKEIYKGTIVFADELTSIPLQK